ncbi:hypothetical protein EGY07_16360 [Chryseobacterium indologenes]|uniref:hypothetical protein n=1 Tax=Chryseobacterium indologenes TaxID=253 RepID=UPI000F4D2F06|nr:hypothetical protein [Chryseobacterium indologenes]AYZ37016.1 hypothetical protein EGY07_16360 [Chryseobacterium indologenes]MBF6645852.1 hypothetical protein [Chryseobacterium indologenes]MBU3048372.1 hypothetical protein [Chryseobacterium indologenes]MEB4760899.1 hypothetical protein [Chryseobacterium indologenes]QQQ70481.1 hypothetical protein JHW31_18655 [Chryseobacterium indologenes]
MEKTIEIQKEDIKKLLLTLVQKLERSEVSKFSFKQDLYWNIPVDELFNVYEEPKLTIGSITEDLEFLEKILDMIEKLLILISVRYLLFSS